MDLLDVARSDDDARSRYNRIAELYDEHPDWFEHDLDEQLLALLDLQPGETVLEIGPGVGWLFVELAEAVGPEGRAIGVDVADEMIERTHERLVSRGMEGRATLLRGDASALSSAAGTGREETVDGEGGGGEPLGDDSVDAIAMVFTLETMSPADQRAVLAECRRVLRDGGRLGVVALSKGSGLSTTLYGWLHRRFPGFFDSDPIDLVETLEGADFELRAHRKESLRRLPVEVTIAS